MKGDGGTPLIEFRNVVKRFGSRTILNQVNLKIFRGEVSTIIGKSGTGKSVLLKHIIGLLTPDSGEIAFDGVPIDKMTRNERSRYLEKISYMFQNNALFDSLTVFDNIALPLRHTTSLSRKEIRQRVLDRIEQTELDEVANRYPAELSGGMQKRAALARALVTDPQIVLFDEPTTGQDPIRRNAILGMISDYQRRFGFTAVLISHDIPDVFFISNRILALYDGRIVFEGSPEELETFEHPFQEEFLQSLEDLERGLTGFYSKRHFKIRYQTDLTRRRPMDSYVVVVFTLEDMDLIIQQVGHTIAQELIRCFGAYLNKHFGPEGGLSTRYRINQLTTLLPFSDQADAENILEGFIEDFRSKGLEEIIRNLREHSFQEVQCFEFSVLAGLAQGKPQIEIDSVVSIAEFKQTQIAKFQCELEKETLHDDL
jgi:phospholipid/cholesterol/gamma-HCH transport system ATP-binding protein